MPRITDQARAARRAQILDAAATLFAANGFHATSMDDILTAAGISAGGAYRYFASKVDIVEAVATDTVSGITAAIDALLTEDPQLPFTEAFRRLVGIIHDVADGPGRLAVVVWGEAQRDPAIAGVARKEAGLVRASIRALAVRAEQSGELPPHVSGDDLANVLFALVAGFLLQQRVLGDADPDAFARSVTSFMSTGDPPRATAPRSRPRRTTPARRA